MSHVHLTQSWREILMRTLKILESVRWDFMHILEIEESESKVFRAAWAEDFARHLSETKDLVRKCLPFNADTYLALDHCEELYAVISNMSIVVWRTHAYLHDLVKEGDASEEDLELLEEMRKVSKQLKELYG